MRFRMVHENFNVSDLETSMEFYEKYGFSREDRVILMGKEL